MPPSSSRQYHPSTTTSAPRWASGDSGSPTDLGSGVGRLGAQTRQGAVIHGFCHLRRMVIVLGADGGLLACRMVGLLYTNQVETPAVRWTSTEVTRAPRCSIYSMVARV